MNHQLLKKPSPIYANVMLFILMANILLCFYNALGLWLMMPIGAWQVIDALFWLLNGDKRRRPYIVVVLIYFAIFYGMIMLRWPDTKLVFFFLFGVPYAIAFWYWYLTWQHAVEVARVSKETLEEDEGNGEQI